jgi:hypothetical protein
VAAGRRAAPRLPLACSLLTCRGMKHSPWWLAALVALAACTDANQPRQVIPAPADPNFTLFVSNQSFAVTPAEISVYLDGELAVEGDFEVGSQHTWLDFDFRLAPGAHELKSVTKNGARIVALTWPVEISDDRDFGVLAFWTDREGATFSFDLQDDQPGFDFAPPVIPGKAPAPESQR